MPTIPSQPHQLSINQAFGDLLRLPIDAEFASKQIRQNLLFAQMSSDSHEEIILLLGHEPFWLEFR